MKTVKPIKLNGRTYYTERGAARKLGVGRSTLANARISIRFAGLPYKLIEASLLSEWFIGYQERNPNGPHKGPKKKAASGDKKA